jgi:MFS family permease
MPRFPVLAALRHGSLARFVLGRFFTTLSWQMLGVAVGWQVYALSHDALALGFVGLAEFLPFISLALLGGHVADHWPQRAVLVGALCTNALGVAALLWFTLAHGTMLWPLYAVILLLGITRAFWQPTTQAVVPSLVPGDEFRHAVSLGTTAMQVGIISGPALGGVLYFYGPGVVYGTCLALFGAGAVLMATLRQRPPPPQLVKHMEMHGRDILEGLRFVLRRPILLGVMSLDLFAVLLGGATALLPLFASDILHAGPRGLGLLRAAPGAGAALTAGLLTLWPLSRRIGVSMFGGVAFFGICTVIFGLSQSFTVSLAALFLLGCGDMISVYVRNMLTQLETPDVIRGRVSAVSSMFVGASNELGEFESGATARWWGAVPAVVVGGAATLMVVLLWMRWFPQVRKLDRLRASAVG